MYVPYDPRRSPSKVKKSKAFKFPSKSKDKREKSREKEKSDKDVKDVKLKEEKKKECKEKKVKDKDKDKKEKKQKQCSEEILELGGATGFKLSKNMFLIRAYIPISLVFCRCTSDIRCLSGFGGRPQPLP